MVPSGIRMRGNSTEMSVSDRVPGGNSTIKSGNSIGTAFRFVMTIWSSRVLPAPISVGPDTAMSTFLVETVLFHEKKRRNAITTAPTKNTTEAPNKTSSGVKRIREREGVEAGGSVHPRGAGDTRGDTCG